MKPMTRAEFHRFLVDPATGPKLDDWLKDCRACDETLTDDELDAHKRSMDAALDALRKSHVDQLGPADGFRRAEFEAAQQES